MIFLKPYWLLMGDLSVQRWQAYLEASFQTFFKPVYVGKEPICYIDTPDMKFTCYSRLIDIYLVNQY